MAKQKRLELRGGKAFAPPRQRKGWNLKTKVKGSLRRLFFISPHRTDALKAAQIVGLGMYHCASCKKPFPKNGVAVDHIEPVVPIHWSKENYWSWDIVIDRMFCPHEGLQVICHNCHGKKTFDEGVLRGFENKDDARGDREE